jgi:hypothetical protein
MNRYKVPVVTAADGSATVYSPRVAGRLHSISYVKNDFASGVDFTIAAEATGENLWTESDVNASTVRNPRAPTHTQAGVAALYAAGGVAVLTPIALANDRIKIMIAQGGNVKSGTFHFLVD